MFTSLMVRSRIEACLWLALWNGHKLNEAVLEPAMPRGDFLRNQPNPEPTHHPWNLRPILLPRFRSPQPYLPRPCKRRLSQHLRLSELLSGVLHQKSSRGLSTAILISLCSCCSFGTSSSSSFPSRAVPAAGPREQSVIVSMQRAIGCQTVASFGAVESS